MADARLAMGQISPEGYSCDTADGAGKDRHAALRRLARTVCADLEEIGEGAAMAIAGQACSRQKEILVAAHIQAGGRARPGEGGGGGISGNGVRANIGEVYKDYIGCLSGLYRGKIGGDRVANFFQGLQKQKAI